jgi:hypothetical protein
MRKRLRNLRDRWYERFMRFMTRRAPKTLRHINDEPFTVLWNPASAHFCPHCDWIYMIWDVSDHWWICPHCGQVCQPPLAITEKRPAILLPSPKATVPLKLRNTGDLARNYHATPEKEPTLIPVGDGPIRRLGTKDGRLLTTEELQAYPHARRTG